MPEEENKGAAGDPPPASGDKPEDQNQDLKGQGEGASKQAEELKKQIEDLTNQLNQAGFSIQKEKEKSKKYKEKLAEAGIETEEEEGGVSAEKIHETVNEALKPVVEQIKGLTTAIGEIARTNQARADAARPGAGDGGQKPPLEVKRPALSPVDEKILAEAGITWNPEKKSFVDPKGNKVDIENVPGVVQGPKE